MDSVNNPVEKLIDKIIAYLENERELYGDFSVSDSVLTHAPKNEPASGEEGADRDVKKNGSGKINDQIEACRSLDELMELCSRSDLLKTDLKNANLVFGTGNPKADLMVIGEAPGEEEDRQGKPFVGAAGQLLDKILLSVKFNREKVYIANVLKYRPPNNRTPSQEERARSLPFLQRQIDLIQPRLILALGKTAAQTLLASDATLGKLRGNFHPFREGIELLATYHPAALLRHEKWKRPTWEDVQMLRKRYEELGCKP